MLTEFNKFFLYNKSMIFHWSIIADILYLNAAIGMVIARRCWAMRSRPGLGYFGLLSAAAAFYSLTYGLEIASSPLALKILWIKVENLGIVTLGPFWILFAIRYTQQMRWFSRIHLIALFIIPFTTLFLLASPWSNLHYAKLSEFSIMGGPLVIARGPWYWVQIIYSYSLILISALLIIRSIVQYPGVYQGRNAIILIGLIIPWLANFYFIFGAKLFPDNYLPVDFTPVAFILTGLLYSIGIFRFGLFDLIPIARDIVFENIPELVMVLDPQNRIIDLNQTGQQWLGITKQDSLGRAASELLQDFAELTNHHEETDNISAEINVAGDEPRDMEVFITPLFDHRGQLAGRVVVGRDISNRNLADQILAEANKHINLQSTALNAAANAIVITDAQGLCIWVNPAFIKTTGYSLGEMLGQRLSKLKSGVQGDDFYRKMWETILKGEIWSGEIVNKHKDGHLYTEDMTIAPVRNEQGQITNFIAIKQDISERKRIEMDLQTANQNLQLQVADIKALQERLREQAIRDPLTGLFNRRYLDETLEREIAKAKRDNQSLCVAMVDVDEFKSFNDEYGHMVGDMILDALSKLLMDNTRQSDIACRYGGDELLVVMPGISLENAQQRAEEWRIMFEANSVSFNLKEGHISISVGLSCFPAHGHNATFIVRAADRALYQAKQKGRNAVAVYDELE
jgi:diguanylate cyclase (GGDEF)-like protein/PAS domain S-box-containing protein